MNKLSRKTTIAATAVTAGVLAIGGTVGGIAYASTPSPSPSSSHSSGTHGKTDGHKHGTMSAARGLVSRHALHGDVVVQTKKQGTVTLQGQRGTVTSVSSTSITVKSTDNFSTTYSLGSKTHVRDEGKQSSASALKSGEKVIVIAEKSGSGWQARTVVIPKTKTTSD